MLAFQGVIRPIIAIQDLPFAMFAWMEGKAFKTWLAEMTGLSKALVYRGGLHTLRPSTQTNIRQHARKRGIERALKKGWSEAEFFDDEQWLLSLEERGAAGWTLFVSSSDNPASRVLSRSIDLALQFDHDLEALRRAAASNDLNGYRAVGADLASIHARQGNSGAEIDLWSSATTWVELESPTHKLLEAYWFEVMACLDGEWGHHHFPAMQPTPLFPFIWPTGDVDLVERGLPWEKFKRTLHRPNRRFLQFIYALFYRSKNGTWPNELPGATKVAEAWGLDAKAVTKYFDSTNLRASVAQSAWDQMSLHFLDEVVGGYPYVMTNLAICWQNTLLQVSASKLKSVIFPDKAAYSAIWQRHHAGLLEASQDKEPWPAWLIS